MMKKHILLLIVFAGLINFSCNNSTCKNTNPIFDQYPPESKEYLFELAKLLKTSDPSKINFSFERYAENNRKPQIYISVKSDAICAILILNIEKSKKGIENYLIHKGKSYQSAEIKDLKYSISQDGDHIKFIFQEIGEIID